MTSFLRTFARVSLCIVIVVVTLELCARTEDKLRYGAPFFRNYSMDSLYTYDALGKYGRPGASYQKWHLNEAGYRGPALRPGAYTIACIGSSETFGLYESPDKEWPRQLEGQLNQWAGRQVYQVVDTAYPGLSIGTALKRLPQMIGAVHPDLVVIYPSYTSYIETDKPQPWPLPKVSLQGPVHAPASNIQWRMSDRLKNFFKASLPDRLQNWIRIIQAHHDSEARNAVDRLPEANVLAFETDMNHLVEELQSQGIHVVLLTHANRFGKTVQPQDQSFLSAWRKFYPSLKEDGFLDMESRMSEAVHRVGLQHHVPVVDAANLIAPGSTDFAEFVHFTDVGAKRLATITATEIEQETEAGTLPGPKVVSQTGTIATRRMQVPHPPQLLKR